MAATAQSIITDAYQKLTLHAVGENPTAAESVLGLTVLNDMLDSWSNESLICFAILEQSVALTSGKSQYTIGSGGTINATRPLRLIEGKGAAYSVDSQGNRYPIDVVPQDQWNSIYNVTNQINSNYPEILFYDPQYPLGILNFWPVPNMGGYTAFWDSYLQLIDFGSLTTTANFPPGYVAALKNNLAIALAPYFSVTPSTEIKEAAKETKAIIKRTNIRTMEASFDLPTSGAPYTLQDFQMGR